MQSILVGCTQPDGMSREDVIKRVHREIGSELGRRGYEGSVETSDTMFGVMVTIDGEISKYFDGPAIRLEIYGSGGHG